VTRHTSFAPGKIIISGEYAVVFGETGIAIPAPIGIRATFMEDTRKDHLDVKWLGIKGNDEWDLYLRRIIGLLERGRSPFRGTLTVMNQLPLQKGLGSSTALVIAVSRALIGKGKEAEALAGEHLFAVAAVHHFRHALEAAEKFRHLRCELDQHVFVRGRRFIPADEYRHVSVGPTRAEAVWNEAPGAEGPEQPVEPLRAFVVVSQDIDAMAEVEGLVRQFTDSEISAAFGGVV